VRRSASDIAMNRSPRNGPDAGGEYATCQETRDGIRSACAMSAEPVRERTLFVGSFTPPKGSTGEGLTTVAVERSGGRLQQVSFDRGGCPAFLVQHPTLDLLYAASELEAGTIDTYAIHNDGSTERIASIETGPSPAHIALGRAGESLFVFTSHYFGGCFAVHRLNEHGAVGPCLDLVDRNAPSTDSSEKPVSRAHCAVFDPNGRFVIATDLGQDEVITYAIEESTGKVTEVSAATTPTGAGPRHLAWHPDGRLFVSGELGAIIMTFHVDPASGELTWVGQRDSLTDPPSFDVHPQPSEIALSHGGQFLHIANRRTDVLSTFATDGDELRPVGDVPTGGETPRHFAAIDDELYIGNQGTDTVRSFSVDPKTGEVAATGSVLHVLNPAVLLFRRR
jgi:6-phosphogluconolactonase